jgi:hypothetical protein
MHRDGRVMSYSPETGSTVFLNLSMRASETDGELTAGLHPLNRQETRATFIEGEFIERSDFYENAFAG